MAGFCDTVEIFLLLKQGEFLSLLRKRIKKSWKLEFNKNQLSDIYILLMDIYRVSPSRGSPCCIMQSAAVSESYVYTVDISR
jgi:hypothetical protein